jgi:hypothetical protein
VAVPVPAPAEHAADAVRSKKRTEGRKEDMKKLLVGDRGL